MSTKSITIAEKVLGRLAATLIQRPKWVVWPQLVLFVLLSLTALLRLEFDMDRNALVGEDKPSHRNFLAFRREFVSQDDMVAIVESEDFEKNRQFVERLGTRLEAESTTRNPTNIFSDVFYKGDLRMMGQKALLFFPTTNLIEFKQALATYRPFMQQFTGATNLSSLFRQINAMIRATGKERNPAKEAEFLQALPALHRLLRLAEESIARPGPSPSPGVEVLFGAGAEAEREKYVTFSKGRIYLVSAKPRTVSVSPEEMPVSWWRQVLGLRPNTSPVAVELRRFALQAQNNAAAITRFRQLVDEVHREVPGVNIGTTGEGVLDYDEMVQTTRDSTLATLLALALVAAIFIIGYHELSRPLMAMACLLIGVGYTMGYTALVIGHLNILTVTFVPMLIGLAIDFGVHLVTRYEEEISAGVGSEEAIRIAVVNTGKGIFTGCVTTAGAFFAMAFTEFRGIREMGVIMGGALILCLGPMITILPVWMLRHSARQRSLKNSPKSEKAEVPQRDVRARIEKVWLNRPWTVLGVSGAICLASIWVLPRIHFDYNLLHMQSEGLPSVIYEHKLIAGAEKSVLYAAVVCNSLEEVVRLEPKLQALSSVSTNISMARFLTDEPTEKLTLIRELKDILEPLKFDPVDSKTIDLTELDRRLFAFSGYIGLASEEVRRALTNSSSPNSSPDSKATPDSQLLTNLVALRAAVANLRGAMFQGNRENAAARLSGFQQAFLEDLRTTIGALQNQDASGPLQVNDLPETLRNRFVGRTGKHLIQVYPRQNVWEREPQEQFVAELRSVDPNVTGTPVQLYEYETLLRDSYIEAAWYALAAIVVIVFFHFRALTPVVLSLLPVFLGALWMVGSMGWLKIPFNLANIMTLPLVIGIGVTNGIHILNRFAEEKNPSILARSTGKAVLVSGVTTIVGFGALIIADHRGIRSLGMVMSFGTATCMVAALTALPAILTLKERWLSRDSSQTAKT